MYQDIFVTHMVSCILGAKHLTFEYVSGLINEWMNDFKALMNIRTELHLITDFYYFQSLGVSMGLRGRMGEI